MEKKNWIIGALVLVVVVVGVFAVIEYNKNLKLSSEVSQLNGEKEIILGEKEKLNSDLGALQLKYDLLNEDVKKIYKSCTLQNACKGRYPGVSWYCNNVGDEAPNYSHVCVCDASCNLNATQVSSGG